MESLEDRLWKRIYKEPGKDGCWLWKGAKSNNGYGRIGESRGGARIVLGVHRLSYELYIGPIGNSCVLHHCDIKNCIRPDHLFLGTPADNSRDMIQKGRSNCGERSSRLVLTEKEVRKILDDCRLIREIAKEYGVSYRRISYIKSGKTWKHIGEQS